MFLSPDGLEMAVGIVTLAGGGWVAYAQLQRSRLEEKIQDNAKMIETQWGKIDELRTKSETYITRDRHDETIKDIYMAIKQAVAPLMDSINRLSDKIDHVIMEKK